MSILCFDVLALLTKKIENKCLTKFRATSKEFMEHVSRRFQYYQSLRCQELKELTYILVSENEKKQNILRNQDKLLQQADTKYKTLKHEYNSKLDLAFKRLQKINTQEKKYQTLYTDYQNYMQKTNEIIQSYKDTLGL